jgi:hypothetical protein
MDVDVFLRGGFLGDLLFISFPIAVGSERGMEQKKETMYENV